MLSTAPLPATPTFLAPPPMPGGSWSYLPPPPGGGAHLPPPPNGSGRSTRKASTAAIVLLTLGLAGLGTLVLGAAAIFLMLLSFGCGCT